MRWFDWCWCDSTASITLGESWTQVGNSTRHGARVQERLKRPGRAQTLINVSVLSHGRWSGILSSTSTRASPPGRPQGYPKILSSSLLFVISFSRPLPMCLSSRTTLSDRPDVDYSIIIAAFQEFVLNMEAVKRNYYWTLFNSTKLEAWSKRNMQLRIPFNILVIELVLCAIKKAYIIYSLVFTLCSFIMIDSTLPPHMPPILPRSPINGLLGMIWNAVNLIYD